MLNNRAFPAVLLAALACAAATDTAHAASTRSTAGPAGRTTGTRSEAGLAGPAGPGGVRSAAGSEGTAGAAAHAAVSARSLSLLSRAIRDHHAPGAKASGAASTMKSTNWAGYAVTGGTYTSVAANWIEPSVTCTSDGIVGFWVGLDGWGRLERGAGRHRRGLLEGHAAAVRLVGDVSGEQRPGLQRAGRGGRPDVVLDLAQSQGRYVMVLTDWTKRWTVGTRPCCRAAERERRDRRRGRDLRDRHHHAARLRRDRLHQHDDQRRLAAGRERAADRHDGLAEQP